MNKELFAVILLFVFIIPLITGIYFFLGTQFYKKHQKIVAISSTFTCFMLFIISAWIKFPGPIGLWVTLVSIIMMLAIYFKVRK